MWVLKDLNQTSRLVIFGWHGNKNTLLSDQFWLHSMVSSIKWHQGRLVIMISLIRSVWVIVNSISCHIRSHCRSNTTSFNKCQSFHKLMTWVDYMHRRLSVKGESFGLLTPTAITSLVETTEMTNPKLHRVNARRHSDLDCVHLTAKETGN